MAETKHNCIVNYIKTILDMLSKTCVKLIFIDSDKIAILIANVICNVTTSPCYMSFICDNL